MEATGTFTCLMALSVACQGNDLVMVAPIATAMRMARASA